MAVAGSWVCRSGQGTLDVAICEAVSDQFVPILQRMRAAKATAGTTPSLRASSAPSSRRLLYPWAYRANPETPAPSSGTWAHYSPPPPPLHPVLCRPRAVRCPIRATTPQRSLRYLTNLSTFFEEGHRSLAQIALISRIGCRSVSLTATVSAIRIPNSL